MNLDQEMNLPNPKNLLIKNEALAGPLMADVQLEDEDNSNSTKLDFT